MSWHCPLNSMTTNYDMYLSFLYCFLRWFTSSKQCNRGTSVPFYSLNFVTLGLTYRDLHGIGKKSLKKEPRQISYYNIDRLSKNNSRCSNKEFLFKQKIIYLLLEEKATPSYPAWFFPFNVQESQNSGYHYRQPSIFLRLCLNVLVDEIRNKNCVR